MYSNAGIPHVQQQVVAPGTANSSVRSHRKIYKRVLYSMGIAEIIIGSLSVIFGIAAVSFAASNRYARYYYRYYYAGYDYYNHTWSYASQGIWCGIFAIVVGILGIRARSNPSKNMYNANMALSIIGAVVMGVLTILSGIAAATSHFQSLLALHCVLALFGFTGLVVMIIHSAYCCAGVCSKSNPDVPMSYNPSPVGMQQPQFIQLANGQYVLAPTQSTAAPPYSAAQVPAVYHQASKGVVPAQMPTNQSYHTANVGNQIVLVPSTIQAAPPIDLGPQPAVFANPQQAAPVGKEGAN